MKENTKETLLNIFCVILLALFAFGFVKIWDVATFTPPHIVMGNGYLKYVGWSVSIDGAKLLRKFCDKSIIESCDDNPFSTPGWSWDTPTVVYEKKPTHNMMRMYVIRGDSVKDSGLRIRLEK